MGASVSTILNQVSTDIDNPPPFKNAPNIRAVDRDGQMKLHPELKPLELDVEASVAYKAAVNLCKEKFEDVLESEEELVVEAVDVTKLMRFKDDVSIRVTSLGSGKCKVDMRSASRVGKGDLGKNAERVNQVLSTLQKTISG